MTNIKEEIGCEPTVLAPVYNIAASNKRKRENQNKSVDRNDYMAMIISVLVKYDETNLSSLPDSKFCAMQEAVEKILMRFENNIKENYGRK